MRCIFKTTPRLFFLAEHIHPEGFFWTCAEPRIVIPAATPIDQ